MSDLVLRANAVSKSYQKGPEHVHVLENISIELKNKESVAIMGESGAGKSTFLNILGGLLSPSSGSVHIQDAPLYELPDNKRAKMRNEHIGFVFQFHYLLPEFTALENVVMPARIAQQSDGKVRAKSLLAAVGLDHRMDHKPGELSGGEQQRVAIARAMMMSPSLLLADEPTGNLDQNTSDQVADVLFSLIRDQGAIILVTHSRRLAEKADKVYRLKKGELVLE